MYGRHHYVIRIFQSTLPAWGATFQFLHMLIYIDISIHAPRMGSDLDGYTNKVAVIDISIHAPRMGSDRRSFAR